MSRLDPKNQESEEEVVHDKDEPTSFTLTPDAIRIARMKGKTAPEFNPNINKLDPVARSYAQRIQERLNGPRAGADSLKTGGAPVGGVALPPKDQFAKIASLSMPQPDFAEEPPENPGPINVRHPPPPSGVGSAYAVNQEMAAGRLARPVSMREAKQMEQGKQKGLSKETIQAISMTQDSVSKLTQDPKAVEQEATAQVAEAMKGATTVVPPTPREDLDKAEEKIVANQDETSGFPDFDAGSSWSPSMAVSKERREAIEKDLKPLDLADMIIKRELTQEVPVVPGRLILTFRTISQKEILWILQYLYDFPGSTMYTRELLSTCQMVCALMAINGSMLPDHRKDGVIEKEAFEKKKDAISSFPTQLIADISVQLIWFQARVNNLFGLDAIKNG
jgi:hypothetical protein